MRETLPEFKTIGKAYRWWVDSYLAWPWRPTQSLGKHRAVAQVVGVTFPSSLLRPCLRLAFVVLSVSVTTPGAAASETYLDEIKPVLEARCYACHGALKQKSGLRVDTAERLLAGADEGTKVVVVPGDAMAGELLRRVTSADLEERMPPEGEPLKPEQVEALRRWIGDGAPVPENEKGDDDPRDHWAFRRIERPPVPGDGTGNPVDAFLEVKLSEHMLKPQPEAERPLLLRRLYLDLIGLPPSIAQLHDTRPCEAIVDELLASPHYGERWGRPWMDVLRYSDWYGLDAQLRNSQKHLWHWRDWIIGSLNADKGYDRMIMEMLAGDEIAPGDPQVVVATGFLARNYYLFNRTTWLDDTIEHTGKAFLGLTLNCAKCHDHKYDPITQIDYYRFRALFEPHQVRLDPVPGVTDLEKDGLPRAFDDHLDAVTYLHLKGDEKNPDKDTKIEPAVPAVFAAFAPETRAVELPAEAYAPSVRDAVQRDHIYAAESAVEGARVALESLAEGIDAALAQSTLALREAELQSVRATTAADRARVFDEGDAKMLAWLAARREIETEIARAKLDAVANKDDEAKTKAAGQRLAKAEEKLVALTEENAVYRPLRVSRKALETPEHNFETYGAIYPSTSSGRRTMLARWITSRDNPLTARVAVNHVWMRHFGEPLVEKVFDFGRQSKRPEHAELLDFLAADFIESGWSFRHLHRLLVTSAAYRRSASNAGADPETLAADPNNVFYWRMPSRRMESDVVRDSLLRLGGALDTTLGGPSLDPAAPNARRSLYLLHSRDQQDKFLSMFDDADVLVCYRRSESIVPQQALALSNSKLALEMADKIAGQISAEDRAAFIEIAFLTLLARKPDAEESAACEAYCADLEKLGTTPESRVRARLVHALLNHNDFITIR
jgi:hypothetical protein